MSTCFLESWLELLKCGALTSISLEACPGDISKQRRANDEKITFVDRMFYLHFTGDRRQWMLGMEGG